MELVVTNKEQDSDTEASGSWAVSIPRYDNHEVGPRIDVWAEENAMVSPSAKRNSRKLFSGDKNGPPLRHLKQNERSSRRRDQIEAYGHQSDS
jgi:hypothetical protein